MKQARYGTTPIPMPKIPSSIAGLPAFANGVLKSLRALRDRPVLIPAPIQIRKSTAKCSFGGIVLNDDPVNNRAIIGGAITCGDQNFNVANYPFPVKLDGTSDGQWLIEISISGISFNTDDDDSLILPGIETATGTPTWNKITYTGSENYTSNTNPTTPTGTGTVVLPVGVLNVSGGTATLANTGCGAFLVDQCAGVFSYSRVDDALEARIQAIEDYLLI